MNEFTKLILFALACHAKPLAAGLLVCVLFGASSAQAAQTLYVNASWTEESCGGHTWGVDAFSTAEAASAAVAADTTKIVAYGGADALGALTVNQDLTIETAETSETVAAKFTFLTVAKGKALTVASGSNFNGGTIAPAGGKIYLSGTTKFSGTIENMTANVDMFYLADGTVLTTDGLTTSGIKYVYMNVVDGAQATLSGAGFDLSAVGISVENGSKLSVREAADLKAKAWFIMSGSEVEFDDTVTAKAAQTSMNVSADSLVTVKNGSTLWANNTLNSYGRTVVEKDNTLKSPYIFVFGDTKEENASGLLTVAEGKVESGSLRIGQTKTPPNYAAELDPDGNNNKDAKVVLTNSTFTSTHTNQRRVVEVGTSEVAGVLELTDTTFGANYTEKAVQKGAYYHFKVGVKGEVALNGASVIDWQEEIDNAGILTLNDTAKLLHESESDNATAITNSGSIVLNGSAGLSSAKGLDNSGTITLKGSSATEKTSVTFVNADANCTIVNDGTISLENASLSGGFIRNNGTIVVNGDGNAVSLTDKVGIGNYSGTLEFVGCTTAAWTALGKVTWKNKAGINTGTLSLKDGSAITVGDFISSIAVDNTSALAAGSVTIGDGQSISLALNTASPSVTVSGAVNVSGTGSITVDMTGATENQYTLIASGTESVYGGNFTVTGAPYTLSQVGNDLVAVRAEPILAKPAAVANADAVVYTNGFASAETEAGSGLWHVWSNRTGQVEAPANLAATVVYTATPGCYFADGSSVVTNRLDTRVDPAVNAEGEVLPMPPAAPGVMVGKGVQRYPWNGIVDVPYRAKNAPAGLKLKLTVTVGGSDYDGGAVTLTAAGTVQGVHAIDFRKLGLEQSRGEATVKATIVAE